MEAPCAALPKALTFKYLCAGKYNAVPRVHLPEGKCVTATGERGNGKRDSRQE